MKSTQIADIEVQVNVREGNIPSSWEFSHENEAFRLKVGNGQAIFYFKYPLATLEEAEGRIDEFLRSWEGDMLIQTGPVRRLFQIIGCRAPGHPGYVQSYGRVSFAANEPIIRQRTPWRRHRYWEIPLVAALIKSYEDYRCGRERLSVLGFLCLSALQHAFSGRKALAKGLDIELPVLNELGRLVSTIGSYGSARKIDRGHDLREFSLEEEYWMEVVSRELIVRAGEVFGGSRTGTRLTMQDLPSL